MVPKDENKSPLSKVSDEWLADALRYGLRGAKALGVPRSIQVEDIKISQDFIQVNFRIANPRSFQILMEELYTTVQFMYGFFDESGRTMKRIALFAKDSEIPIVFLESSWEAAKHASEGDPWTWLMESEISKMAPD